MRLEENATLYPGLDNHQFDQSSEDFDLPLYWLTRILNPVRRETPSSPLLKDHISPRDIRRLVRMPELGRSNIHAVRLEWFQA